jgi:hypothetical protein
LLITKRRDYIDTMRQNATGAEVSHFPSFFCLHSALSGCCCHCAG